MPLKIAGMEMITIDALTVAMRMPGAVLDSTDHVEGARPARRLVYSGQALPWMISTKSARVKPGLKCSRTSALTVPNVLSGR